MSFISYAQNFEDVMLWRALKHVENGFYVDVGAQDPIVDSVSLAFYERGWRGVHVEPVNEYAQLLRAARPDEEVIEKAVAAETGEMTLHVIPGTGLSSLVEASALSAVALRGYEHAKLVVPVITLDELLAPYSGRDIQWLKIDVEGAEFDVLRGWNAKRDRPWIMVVEATVPNSKEECHQEWDPILLAADYQFVYFDGLSRFYVAREHGDLALSFRTPPNIFDEFVRADLIAAITARDENARQCSEVRYRLDETTAQLDVQRQQLAVTEKLTLERHHLLEKAKTDTARLVAENAQLTAQVDESHSELRGLESELKSAREQSQRAQLEAATLTADLDQTRSELRDLESELKSAGEDRQRAQVEIATLTAELDQTHLKLRALESEVALLNEAYQNARVEVVALTTKREAIVKSASWRLTAPLRRLKRIISRR